MKIIVLGSNGMLGTYLKKYLSKKYEVLSLTRSNIDLLSPKKEIIEYLDSIVTSDDILINSAGLIKQRDVTLEQMTIINSLLPHYLSELKDKKKFEVIHITTDCVFSGKLGNYDELSEIDCKDYYGLTKYLGENKQNMNIRTSIIGEEIFNRKSLLEWAKSKKGQEVEGYTNHLWNGVTCLELCKLIDYLITNGIYWKGVRHIFSPETVSKFELLQIINEIYDLNLKLNKSETENYCFRNLSSQQDSLIKKDLRTQILELKKFNIFDK